MDLWRLSVITTFVNVATLPRAFPAAASCCHKNWSTKLSIIYKVPASPPWQGLPSWPGEQCQHPAWVRWPPGSAEVTAAILISHSISTTFPCLFWNYNFCSKIYSMPFACREVLGPSTPNTGTLVEKRNNYNSSSDQWYLLASKYAACFTPLNNFK